MIIILDMGMFTYYKSYYSIFRRITLYPKYGNMGFGFSFGKPQKILEIPEKLKLISIDDISGYIDECIEIFIKDCNDFFESNKMNISTDELINKLLNDKDMQPDGTSTIFELFRKILFEKTVK
jgi:hypothetical protein